ncbi:SprT family zinc-dependent metalloprotease [Paraferrimonas haliotis]|uniref:Protein SprT n=1 Tax=Paraferrimonas haliotis TaxID=2013866 RepID=A0AA37TNV8_9GAMM|nr:SprT family zinc-dependent metalloprotease [Paraferrimonas haliotis]GLS83093.1 protein SprT [Paraferrimonas haliotis]
MPCNTDLTPQQALLLERVEACYRQLDSHYKTQFTRPQVSFKLRGRSAGTAHLSENRLRFNPKLMQDNLEAFLTDVVPHEVAHLICFQRHGRVRPHGKEWQQIMRHVFQCEPKTTHNFDVSKVSGPEFTYQCQCGPVQLTLRRHNKVLRGAQYLCRRCHQQLVKV